MIVTATNQAGSAQAASARSAPVGVNPPRASVVRSRLRRALSISRRASRIASLLGIDGYLFEFAAPTAGTLTVKLETGPCSGPPGDARRASPVQVHDRSIDALAVAAYRAGVRVLERSSNT